MGCGPTSRALQLSYNCLLSAPPGARASRVLPGTATPACILQCLGWRLRHFGSSQQLACAATTHGTARTRSTRRYRGCTAAGTVRRVMEAVVVVVRAHFRVPRELAHEDKQRCLRAQGLQGLTLIFFTHTFISTSTCGTVSGWPGSVASLSPSPTANTAISDITAGGPSRPT